MSETTNENFTYIDLNTISLDDKFFEEYKRVKITTRKKCCIKSPKDMNQIFSCYYEIINGIPYLTSKTCTGSRINKRCNMIVSVMLEQTNRDLLVRRIMERHENNDIVLFAHK